MSNMDDWNVQVGGINYVKCEICNRQYDINFVVHKCKLGKKISKAFQKWAKTTDLDLTRYGGEFSGYVSEVTEDAWEQFLQGYLDGKQND